MAICCWFAVIRAAGARSRHANVWTCGAYRSRVVLQFVFVVEFVTLVVEFGAENVRVLIFRWDSYSLLVDREAISIDILSNPCGAKSGRHRDLSAIFFRRTTGFFGMVVRLRWLDISISRLIWQGQLSVFSWRNITIDRRDVQANCRNACYNSPDRYFY